MKILLTRDVPDLGMAGDVKTVADGYARNYLIPQGLAVKATPGVLRQTDAQRRAEAVRRERMAAQAAELAQRLSTLTLTFQVMASETGRLYGSITLADIAEALGREMGREFDRRKILLPQPIRQLGTHLVPVRLAADVVPEVTVVVQAVGEQMVEVALTEHRAVYGHLPPEDAAESSEGEELPGAEV